MSANQQSDLNVLNKACKYLCLFYDTHNKTKKCIRFARILTEKSDNDHYRFMGYMYRYKHNDFENDNNQVCLLLLNDALSLYKNLDKDSQMKPNIKGVYEDMVTQKNYIETQLQMRN